MSELALRRIFTLILLAFGLSFAFFMIQGSDVFMYLALARDYLAKGDWNFSDIYLYSRPGTPLVWVHEYWSYWLFYGAWNLAGNAGLVALKMLLLAAIFSLVLLAPPRTNNISLLWIALWCLAVVAASFRFIERSSLISDLLTVLCAYWLLNSHQIERRLLARLTILFALWIQFHPGFPIALAFLALWCAWNLVFNPQFKAKDLLWLALPIGALFLNPLGWRGVVYPFTFALNEAQLLKYYNYEWFATYHPAFRFTPEVIAFWVLAAMSLFIIAREKSWRSFRAWISLMALTGGCMAVRFVPWASFVIVMAIKPWCELKYMRPRPALRWAIAALLILVAAKNLVSGYQSSSGPRRPGWGLDSAHFPSRTIEFLHQNPIPGQLYNVQEFGAYLIWLGMTPVFDHGFVTDLDFYKSEVIGPLQSQARFLELAQKYNWTMLLVDKGGTYGSLYPILAPLPEWRIVAEDDAAYLIYRLPSLPQH